MKDTKIKDIKDAYFWAGTSSGPSARGFLIPDERGRTSKLGAYSHKNILLSLPTGKSLQDIKWLSIWSRSFSVNFGHVMFPTGLAIPRGANLGPLPSLAHGVRSGPVVIQDAKTIFIPRFQYDGAAPDAYFLVGQGVKPRSLNAIKVPDENGRKVIRQLEEATVEDEHILGHLLLVSKICAQKEKLDEGYRVVITNEPKMVEPLRGYRGRDLTLHLPGNLTFYDIDWFSVYCISFEENFGHLVISRDLTVPPHLEDLELFEGRSSRETCYNRLTVECAIDELPASESSPLASYETNTPYYGKLIGNLITNAHNVSGKVYAASDDTFFIENFIYDGKGPDAYFWAGSTPEPSSSGFIVPDELGTTDVLRRYSGQNLVLTLPNGRKIRDIRWFSVWCRTFTANFGWVRIPGGLEVPRETAIGTLPSFSHGLRSGPVILRDVKTILISKLYYDGAAPDGTKVPDENGSLERLRGYRGRDVLLRLPGNLTVFDISWLSVYCISFRENFGHVTIPRDVSVPADLDSLRASIELDNCEEVFPDKLQVSWKMTNDHLYVQLEGKLEDNEYMAFGRSGNDERAQMIGADVVVAFFDKDLGVVRVVDYFLTNKGQCTRTTGACPDLLLGGSQNVELRASLYEEGRLRVTYRRPLAATFIDHGTMIQAHFGESLTLPLLRIPGVGPLLRSINWLAFISEDHSPIRHLGTRPIAVRSAMGDALDLSIPAFVPVSMVAAIGPLNSRKEVAFHHTYFTREPLLINFGRSPASRNCSAAFSRVVEVEEMKSYTWPTVNLTHTSTFHARIGPAGGKKGYLAITGIQPWGVAWWINGRLIPELVVVRGKNYTFIVEGGDDPTHQASYHPFYITNNPRGGVAQNPSLINTPEHVVYAGVETDYDGNVVPVGVGRLCEYQHKTVDMWRESDTFEAYNATLVLRCRNGEPGMFVWTPDQFTPDLVYYQCYTHRNLGWKIHVLDEEPPEEQALSSATLPVVSITVLLAMVLLTAC
ncbi:hypothetical protein LAZ67_1002664 [Cordylochernes scorpioides]|uniref:Protein Skeletor n=1 Tax=Cordylochernes scorpioides TaxID=51811 RepID=A0ABY6JW94_9ARAC|nr:hypothetical protein LAZ67_1002664 [Cordylochernes scorpioides]